MPIVSPRCRFLVLISLLVLCYSFSSFSQEILIKHYSVREGLPSSTVYDIIQDKQGFVWICTESGVSRFDGIKFTNYTLNDGLSENEILKLSQDSKGRIWFLGFNGTLSYYLNGKFFSSLNDSLLKKVPHSNSFMYFFEDQLHRLWFTSLDGYTIIDGDHVNYLPVTNNFAVGHIMNNSKKGVNIISRKKIFTVNSFTEKNHPYYDSKYFNIGVNSFMYLPGGDVLFQAPEGIILQKDINQELLFPLDKRIRDAKINNILIDSRDKLWITTMEMGVFCYDYKNPSKPPRQYLSDKHTTSITLDNEGNLWIGTIKDGIYVLQTWNNVEANYYSSDGAERNYIYSVAKDDKGIIYAGMDNGKVLIINHDKITTRIVNSTYYPYNPISKIQIKGDILFFGSNEGLTSYNRRFKKNNRFQFSTQFGRVFSSIAIKDICNYKDGLAICTSYAIFINTTFLKKKCELTIFKEIDKERIRRYAVFADKKNTLWYSDATGLHSFNGIGNVETGSPLVINRLLREKINGISETEDSALVLATYGQGVLFYKNGKIQATFSKNDGLSGNICKRAFVYKDVIYIATENGVTRFKYHNGHIDSIRQFNTSNGLVSNDVNDIYADDKDICVASSAGLTILNAKATEKIPPAPAVYITRVLCNGKELSPDSPSILNYKQNSLHFEFIGIYYKSANDVHYQYQLQNAKQLWRETNNTSVDFAYLRPGDYIFEVRAKILNGAWGEPKKYKFTIKQPYWRTFPFMACEFILLVITIAFIARYIVSYENNKRNKKLMMQNQIIHLEQQALQAMMNPHFIFNVMNSIQYYINNNDKREANQYLTDFAQLIRMNLDISSKRNISLEEEINYLNLYLSLESLRFAQRLTYNITVDPAIDIDETMIPVMLIQPFIENALWHGILPMKGNGHVQVVINKLANGMLKIEITDNGVGMPKLGEEKVTKIKTHESKGMQMTRHRLDLLGKISGHSLNLYIHDAFPGMENRGTKVEFLLPGNLQ